jgi:hypothetical protein
MSRAWLVGAWMSALLFASWPLAAQEKTAAGTNPRPIQVAMIQSEEIAVPLDFQMALYENLISELQKKGFSQVYREGDHHADGANDLLVFHSTIRKFKKGSEETRRLTTFGGATSITVHCALVKPDGSSAAEEDIVGKVRFLGGNLRATYDFAEKAARLAQQNVAAPSQK